MRKLRGALAILAITLGGTPVGTAAPSDAPAITPLSQVRPGMAGYGLTVLRGTTIERFDVQILGILKGGPASDLILFRATGPAIDQAGGTAEGMSGSPIFVNGGIIGALGYGFHFAGRDSNLSLATPIEEMLRLLAQPGAGSGRAAQEGRGPRIFQAAAPIPTAAGAISRVVLMESPADARAYNAHPLPRTIAASPAAVPMFVAGVSPAAFTLATRVLGRYNVIPTQGYGGSRDFTPPPVEPGSSLGVELVRGDVEMGALGTVTYRRGNQILAFGHPFLNAGAAAMPMTAAWIDTVVRSVDSPFKQGSLGPLVGGTTQDRSTGLGGEVGRYPRMFAVRVRVRDSERGPVHETNAQVVRRPDLAESLVPLVVLSGVQRALDRVSGGSARVRIGLRVRGIERDIVREDLAYDAGDIATAAVLEVPGASQLLFGNFFKTLDPIDMTVDIGVESQPNTALLVRASPEPRTVSRGQHVRVGLRLWPYGGSAPVDRTVQFMVPDDFPPGPAFLIVGSGGGLNDPTPVQQKFQILVGFQATPPGSAGSLAGALDDFENFGMNTDVLVDLLPAPVVEAVGANANPAFTSTAATSLRTEWVVLGRFQIPMVVK